MSTEQPPTTAQRAPRARRPDARQQTTLGNRFRFLVRVLGLTGGLAAATGWVLAADALPPLAEWTAGAARAVVEGAAGPTAQAGTIALLAGAAAVVLALLVELFGVIFLAAGRKTAVGTNAAVQTALAVALLVVVNALGFRHSERYDLTRRKQFTLQPELVSELKALRPDSPTTVVVLQLHKTAGTLSDKPDHYDSAAERKVVEKVTDLVDQLRELGPRFNVVVLDVQDRKYRRELTDVTRRRPGLAEAIDAAPENSIFFYADGKVRAVPRAEADRLTAGPGRPAVAPDPDDPHKALVYPGAVTRMSFTDFYQLDKTASQEATPAEREQIAAVLGGPAYAPGIRGKGNLVLIPRGNPAFVRKVLALEERKPRVGLAVIHPLLSSRENYDEYTAAGLRKALEANGFEVVDVIVKKWGRGGPPTPAASTYEESELDRVENRYNALSSTVSALERGIPAFVAGKAAADKSLAAADAAPTREERVKHLNDALRQVDQLVQLRGRITEEQLRQVVAGLDRVVPQLKEELAEASRQLAELGPRYQALLRDDRASENRRVTDVKAKLKQYAADCDLLIVPRLTVIDLARGDIIPPALYNLSKDQAEVVKEFLKVGKPVLFAMGPTNVERGGFNLEPAGDDVEKMLPQLGVVLGRQTILTDPEVQAMAERQNEALGGSVDVPPLVFDVPEKPGQAPNPIAAAFRTTARAVDKRLDVRKGGFRPVYPAPAAERQPFNPVIATTDPASFNKDRPLADDDYLPKFDPAKQDVSKRGTREEERREAFPVGVAVEAPVPVDWLDADGLPNPALPAASVAGAAGAYPVAPPGFGPGIAAAAAAFPFDQGLSAAMVTLAAEQVKRPTVRVVVYGHGGLFTGRQLDPANEALLLDTCNWLLKRDDRLPADVPDDQKWRYPRADLSPREFFVWRWGTFLGLPLLCAYFGLIALMVRKVR